MKLQKKYKYFLFYLYYLTFTLSLLGCTSDSAWMINEKQMTEAPQEMAMPVEFFKENIETTNYTALVYLKRAKVLNRPIWPFNYLSDYLNHMYEAEVIETFNGAEHKEISYSVMAEADIKPYLPNYPIILSLCGSIETGYYIPDNGYESAASDLLINFGRAFKKGKKPNNNTKSVCN